MANMIQDETPNSIYNVLLYYVKHTRNQATTEKPYLPCLNQVSHPLAQPALQHQWIHLVEITPTQSDLLWDERHPLLRHVVSHHGC